MSEVTAPKEKSHQLAVAVGSQQSAVSNKVYDADALQYVPLEIEVDGELFDVQHRFESLTDTAIFSYDEMRETVLSADGNNQTLKTESTEANLWLWKELIKDVFGYEEPKPSDWKEQIDDDDKLSAIDALLAADVVQEAKVLPTSKKLAWGKRAASGRTITLRAIFNGVQVTTQHHFKPKTAQDEQDFRALNSTMNLQRKALLKRGEFHIPSQIRAKAKLYDSLIDSTEGYAGRVPAHHKALAITDYFTGTAHAIEKK